MNTLDKKSFLKIALTLILVFGFFFSLNNNVLAAKKTTPVKTTKAKAKTTITPKKTVAKVADEYLAQVSKTTDYLKLQNGQSLTYKVKIKNIGSKEWIKNLVSLETGPYLKTPSNFKAANWVNHYQATKIVKNVKPNETIEISFNLLGSSSFKATVQENFQLVFNNQPIKDSSFRLFIDNDNQAQVAQTVTEPAQVINTKTNTTTTNQSSSIPSTSTSITANLCSSLSSDQKALYIECQTNPNENDSTNGVITNLILTSEPMIRIGIFNTVATQSLTANRVVDVYGGDELLLSGVEAGQILSAKFDFNSKQYTLIGLNTLKVTNKPLRFIPRDSVYGVITLNDYSDKPKWNSTINYNSFRNIIEFRYSEKNNKLWVINELPFESYIKGLAETSNYSPVEFQKVMAVAARSYAMYHYLRGIEYGLNNCSTKHGYDYFHLDSVYDQVYKGYNSELLLTGLSKAVNETRGVVVTYQGKPVITPYYSNSDGRTRAWEEVWGGSAKPWLKSVSVPEDSGKALLGHGVGLSARGGLLMITQKNKTYSDVLKYFYSDSGLSRIY